MNLEIVTHELLSASVEELPQTLRLIANRSLALHDTVIIDRNGRAGYRKSDATPMHSQTLFSIWQLDRKPDFRAKYNSMQAVPLAKDYHRAWRECQLTRSSMGMLRICAIEASASAGFLISAYAIEAQEPTVQRGPRPDRRIAQRLPRRSRRISDERARRSGNWAASASISARIVRTSGLPSGAYSPLYF
jgi:hypothetical protein